MPPSNTGPVYFPIAEEMVGPIRPVLLLLLGAVICLLLIACKNLTNLMLARSAARRVHLLHKWLTESILLTTGGGLTGMPGIPVTFPGCTAYPLTYGRWASP